MENVERGNIVCLGFRV